MLLGERVPIPSSPHTSTGYVIPSLLSGRGCWFSLLSISELSEDSRVHVIAGNRKKHGVGGWEM